MLQTQAQVTKVETLADRSLKISIVTPELNFASKSSLFELANKEVWIAFKETKISEDELNIPESITEFKTDKTPSQRLRSIIYIYWEKNKKKEIDFDSYYKQQIEKIIDYLKEKLN